MTPSMLGVDDPGLSTHLAAHGPLPQLDPATLVTLLERSGLRGLGGAGFATWRKWSALAPGRRRVVIANGAEGEPLSRKDRVLLTRAPHLVLDGLALAIRCTGADQAWLAVNAEVEVPVRRALAERPELARVQVEVVSDRFVSGESSAVIDAIAGGPGLPTDRWLPATARGLHGRPTLVNNVETLAQVARIARDGAAGGAATVTSSLVSVGIVGSTRPVQVWEVDRTSTLADILDWGGVDRGRTRAVLVGGFHGSWLDLDRHEPADLRWDPEALAAVGARMGAGVIAALPDDRCPLGAVALIADRLAAESAGRCGPCRLGLPALAAELDRLAAAEPGPDRRLEVQRLAAQVDGRGSCHHPDATVAMVRSALSVFDQEFLRHAAGVCSWSSWGRAA